MVQSDCKLPALLAAVLLLANMPSAYALSTCCDVDGRPTCGHPPPDVCDDRVKRVINAGGVIVVKEKPPSEEELALREAEEKRKAEQKAKEIEKQRKDNLLLSRYASAAEIDSEQQRAIDGIKKRNADVETNLDEIQKQKKKIMDEAAFYENAKMPDNLAKKLAAINQELSKQQELLAKRDAEIEATKQQFQAEKSRYLQLTGASPGSMAK